MFIYSIHNSKSFLSWAWQPQVRLHSNTPCRAKSPLLVKPPFFLEDLGGRGGSHESSVKNFHVENWEDRWSRAGITSIPELPCLRGGGISLPLTPTHPCSAGVNWMLGLGGEAHWWLLASPAPSRGRGGGLTYSLAGNPGRGAVLGISIWHFSHWMLRCWSETKLPQSQAVYFLSISGLSVRNLKDERRGSFSKLLIQHGRMHSFLYLHGKPAKSIKCLLHRQEVPGPHKSHICNRRG